jgi:hypothetical protein
VEWRDFVAAVEAELAWLGGALTGDVTCDDKAARFPFEFGTGALDLVTATSVTTTFVNDDETVARLSDGPDPTDELLVPFVAQFFVHMNGLQDHPEEEFA